MPQRGGMPIIIGRLRAYNGVCHARHARGQFFHPPAGLSAAGNAVYSMAGGVQVTGITVTPLPPRRPTRTAIFLHTLKV